MTSTILLSVETLVSIKYVKEIFSRDENICSSDQKEDILTVKTICAVYMTSTILLSVDSSVSIRNVKEIYSRKENIYSVDQREKVFTVKRHFYRGWIVPKCNLFCPFK